jgi:hypothetical protein
MAQSPSSGAAGADQPAPALRVCAGTTRRRGTLDLVAVIGATRPASALGPGYRPEQVAIIRLSQRPISVAELAAHLELPVSVVRVFLADLLRQRLIVVRPPQFPGRQRDDEILGAMLDGLRAL